MIHGKPSTYARGCRCDLCKHGHATQANLARARAERGESPSMVRALGSQRRIQALMTIGHCLAVISMESGVERPVLQRALTGHSLVEAENAQAIARVFDQMSMRLPAQATHVERIAMTTSMNRARSNGWAPPLAWDEDTIDDPTAEPQGVRTAEQSRSPYFVEVVDLFDSGFTPAQIIQRVQRSATTIQRQAYRANRPDIAVYFQPVRERKAA